MLKKHWGLILAIPVAAVLLAVAVSAYLHASSAQNGLIFTVFTPELQKASDSFYSKYLSQLPNVANYSGKVIEIKKHPNGYTVKFGIEPYLGPHFPVGYDEVTFFTDNIGSIRLLEFSHQKNYELPSRLGVTVKKPIPLS